MKKVLSIIILVSMLFAIYANTISAAVPDMAVPAESAYLSSYGATASTGDASGSIDVTFIVRSPISSLTKIGVSKIVVCRYDGTPIRTYYGTETNNLLTSGVRLYTYTYTITNLEPGTSYYAEVTVIAADSSGSDTRVVTTNTVKAAS